MTASIPNSRTAPSVRSGLPVRRGRVCAGWAVLLVLSVFAGGCKSKGANGLTRTDPLMSDQRIPPTVVPLPEPNGGLGNRNPRNDPLLGSPTGLNKDRTGSSRKDDVDRWKGPYIPSQADTPAALTAKLRNDHSDLALGDRTPKADRPDAGVKLQPARGAFPVSPSNPSTPVSLGQIPKVLEDDLAAMGIQRGDYELVKSATNEFAIRARVTKQDGTTTRYEEVGPSAAAAVQRLLDQIKSDRPR